MSSSPLRLICFLILCAGLSLSSACATVVSGSQQSVTVDTEPSGAVCDLSRGPEMVGVINPTPGTVLVEKSKDDITVSCELEDYLPSDGMLSSSFQGMTFGNVLLGGLIGVGIDAASGAMNEYPKSILIELPPDTFATAAERDAYFDARIAKIEARYDEAVTSAEGGSICRKDPDGLECQRLMSKIDSARARDIQTAESQRQMVAIVLDTGEPAVAATTVRETDEQTEAEEVAIETDVEPVDTVATAGETDDGTVLETAGDETSVELAESGDDEPAFARPDSASSDAHRTSLCRSQVSNPKCRIPGS